MSVTPGGVNLPPGLQPWTCPHEQVKTTSKPPLPGPGPPPCVSPASGRPPPPPSPARPPPPSCWAPRGPGSTPKMEHFPYTSLFPSHPQQWTGWMASWCLAPLPPAPLSSLPPWTGSPFLPSLLATRGPPPPWLTAPSTFWVGALVLLLVLLPLLLLLGGETGSLSYWSPVEGELPWQSGGQLEEPGGLWGACAAPYARSPSGPPHTLKGSTAASTW